MHPILQVKDTTLHVFLADFGLTRILTSAYTSTKTSAKGTPGFQAREVLTDSQLTIASDIYSFGCVLIEMFANRCVWPNLTPVQIICKVVAQNATPDVCDVKPPFIKDICIQCFQEAGKRPSAESVLHNLVRNTPDVMVRLLNHAFRYTMQD